jgi:hypothetical protein
MIGISIMTAIGILVGAFTLIFTVLDPFVSDFVGPLPEPTQVPVGEELAARSAPNNPPPNEDVTARATDPLATPTEPPAPPTPTPTADATPPEDAFEPDYRVTAQGRINFREGPGVRFPAIVAIDPGTEVQSLGESQETQNPAADLLSPGREWLKFRLEDGREGWIRDIDVAPIAP